MHSWILNVFPYFRIHSGNCVLIDANREAAECISVFCWDFHERPKVWHTFIWLRMRRS